MLQLPKIYMQNEECMKLFGTDGVRGKAGEEKLNAMTAMRVAMAAGIYFRKHSVTNKIIVGKDTRRSGYMIENAIVSGLTAVGYDVRQIGPMPTPAIAFLSEDMRCDGGIMISASHNPYYDNGIKFFDCHGDKLNEIDEKEIEDIYFNDKLIEQNQQTGLNIGSSKRIDDVIGRYIGVIKNSFPKDLTLHGLRIVLDVANGAAYKVAPTIFTELGAEVIVLANQPNGNNINLNCGALHPENLCDQVKHLRADVGFAFDGDADRLVVVDDKGKVVHGDKLLGVLVTHLRSVGRLKGNALVATLMSNKALENYLEEHNLELHRANVGDKYVLEMMKEHGINLGGEQSGHIIFSDYAKTGDALVAAMQVMALLLRKNQKASKLLNPFELYPQIQSNIKIQKKIPFEKIQGFNELKDELESSDIRTLVRYSGTENLLRLLVEAKDEQIAKDAHARLEKFFAQVF